MSTRGDGVDLHLHSTHSDGLLAPAEVVDRAADAGVQLLALTDHDTVAGVAAAHARCQERGLTCANGVEISASWRGQSIHVIALDFDAACPALLAGLESIRAQRLERLTEIARRLERKSLPAPEIVAALRESVPVLTRTHLARALVQRGHARSQQEVFKRWLGRGTPGHVPSQYPEIATVAGWIRSAGGLPVLAHPLRYKLSAGGRRQLLQHFRECGGHGLEVACGSAHSQVPTLAALAQRFDLAGSVGSDFHDPQIPWNLPGRLAKLPAAVTPVWQSFRVSHERAHR